MSKFEGEDLDALRMITAEMTPEQFEAKWKRWSRAGQYIFLAGVEQDAAIADRWRAQEAEIETLRGMLPPAIGIVVEVSEKEAAQIERWRASQEPDDLGASND